MINRLIKIDILEKLLYCGTTFIFSESKTGIHVLRSIHGRKLGLSQINENLEFPGMTYRKIKRVFFHSFIICERHLKKKTNKQKLNIFRKEIMQLGESLEMNTVCTDKEKKRHTRQRALWSSHLGLLHVQQPHYSPHETQAAEDAVRAPKNQ